MARRGVLRSGLAIAGLLAGSSSCSSPPAPGAPARAAEGGAQAAPAVDDARLRAADPASWLSYGRTLLRAALQPARRRSTSTTSRGSASPGASISQSQHGVEATPLVADGVMYVTAPWSVVYALDAATGELLWSYDPRGAAQPCAQASAAAS